jgi:hypothetical protein
MSSGRGAFKVKVGDQEYTLWLGMSVLADLQDKHGQDALQRLDAPAGAGPEWVPPLSIVVDLFLGALQRYHADVADKYLVDEILAENATAFQSMMAAAFPDQKGAEAGNGRKVKKVA